jgi:hypothetical protein
VASKATAQSLDGKAARFKGSGKKQTLHQAKHLSYMQAVLLLDLCPKGGSNEALISNPSPTKKKKKKISQKEAGGKECPFMVGWGWSSVAEHHKGQDKSRGGENLPIFKYI